MGDVTKPFSEKAKSDRASEKLIATHGSRGWRKKYALGADVWEVIIGGRSAIDAAVQFPIERPEDVERYLENYGYSLQQPIEAAELIGNFREALNFIKRYFLFPENSEGLKIEVPRKLQELHDIKELFLMVRNHDDSHQKWACAILRVMHTIGHIDKDVKSSYFGEVQKQIFDRFYKAIHRTEDGALFLGSGPKDPERVELTAFETKPSKTRDSVILKLLHKPENVAEELFDRVGIRLVARTAVGVLRTIQYLRDQHLVIAPNIKPSRSRNTWRELTELRKRWTQLLKESENDPNLSEERFVERLEQLLQQGDPVTGAGGANEHTLSDYRAIQFTGRQLIKLRNPLFQDLREVRNLAKELEQTSPLARAIERIDMKFVQKDIRFFYPFEVQIVDAQSHTQNEVGVAAHKEYKRAQVQTALKRVMAAWLPPVGSS